MMNWQSDLFRRLCAMLLVLLVGAVVALCCVGGDVHLWMQSFGLAPWALALATTARLLLALALAVTMAAFIRLLLPHALGGVAFWLGKALAFYPVTLAAWSFLGWWIGQLGHPIWTLMPASESEASLSLIEAWARWSWTWIPVVGIMAVPLTGQCLSLCLERDARSRDVGIDLLGLLALLLAICVEDIFAIRGVGTYLTAALRRSDAMSLASAVWLLTSIGLALAAILSMSEHWMPELTGAGRWSRLLIGTLFKISAWCLPSYIMFRGISGGTRSGAGSVEWLTAFDDPAAILKLGLPWMLGALALWALGHRVQPR